MFIYSLFTVGNLNLNISKKKFYLKRKKARKKGILFFHRKFEFQVVLLDFNSSFLLFSNKFGGKVE